ncbi:MAG: RidA family protein [Haloarcula sp.]
MHVDTGLSKESKRQREGTESTGAFGKRTGESDLVFFEGILPESDSEILSERDIEAQIMRAFDNLEAKLAGRGNKTLDDVMKIEVQLTDPDAAEVVDTVYESRFEGVEFPPRTVVGVCSLPGNADIQLDVIAAAE